MIVHFYVEKSLAISFIENCLYKIEVVYSESDHGVLENSLVSEIFAFNHLMEYARDRQGRRNHVHLN